MELKTTWKKFEILLEQRRKSGSLLLQKFVPYPKKGNKEKSFLEIKMCNSKQTFVHSEYPFLNIANRNIETYVVSNNTHKS